MKALMRLLSTAPFRRRSLLALLLGAGALMLGGCLGGADIGGADEPSIPLENATGADGPGPAAAVLAAAATKTTGTGSAKLEMTLAMTIPGAPERVDIGMSGAFDLEGQRGRLVLDYGNLVEALGPDSAQVGAFLPDRLIFEPTAVYLRMPRLAEVVQGSKKWIKLDVQQLAADQGLQITGVDQLGQADPTQLLALLESLEGAIEDLGADDVRGQPATHYRATINMAKLAATAPADQQALLEGQLDQLSQLGLDSLPVEVWVDGEGRVVRMAATIAVPDTGTGGGTIAFDVELFDFGAPVKIKTPAPKHVSSVESLLAAIGAGITG